MPNYTNVILLRPLEDLVPASPVMALLSRGVPLTLLLDLAEPAGPDSVAINAVERPPGDPIWLDGIDLRVNERYDARHAG